MMSRMLPVFWMLLPCAIAFRAADIISDTSDTNSSGGDEMCCCYKKKKAYSNLAVVNETIAHDYSRPQKGIKTFGKY